MKKFLKYLGIFAGIGIGWFIFAILIILPHFYTQIKERYCPNGCGLEGFGPGLVMVGFFLLFVVLPLFILFIFFLVFSLVKLARHRQATLETTPLNPDGSLATKPGSTLLLEFLYWLGMAIIMLFLANLLFNFSILGRSWRENNALFPVVALGALYGFVSRFFWRNVKPPVGRSWLFAFIILAVLV